MNDEEDPPPLTGKELARVVERTAIMRHGGERPPDECLFHCSSCGFRGTLKFDSDEMALLDNDATRYSGPCPKCQMMTLVSADALIGDALNLQDMAEKRLTRQVNVAVDAAMDRVEKKVGEMMGAKAAATDASDEDTKPGVRSGLPDAKDIDLDDGDVR
jgi:hypothetical protein